jgi:hypothetical protein
MNFAINYLSSIIAIFLFVALISFAYINNKESAISLLITIISISYLDFDIYILRYVSNFSFLNFLKEYNYMETVVFMNNISATFCFISFFVFHNIIKNKKSKISIIPIRFAAILFSFLT